VTFANVQLVDETCCRLGVISAGSRLPVDFIMDLMRSRTFQVFELVLVLAGQWRPGWAWRRWIDDIAHDGAV